MPSPRLAMLGPADRDIDPRADAGCSRKRRRALPERAPRERSSRRAAAPWTTRPVSCGSRGELVEWALDQLPRDVVLAGRDPARDARARRIAHVRDGGGDLPVRRRPRHGPLPRAAAWTDLAMVTRVADAARRLRHRVVLGEPDRRRPRGPRRPRRHRLHAAEHRQARHGPGAHAPAEVPYALELVRLLRRRPGGRGAAGLLRDLLPRGAAAARRAGARGRHGAGGAARAHRHLQPRSRGRDGAGPPRRDRHADQLRRAERGRPAAARGARLPADLLRQRRASWT